MKKYLALLLVLVMALGMFAACGETTPPATEPKGTEPAGTTPAQTTAPAPKDPITLVWHVRGNGNQKDNAKVMEEFNKKLQAIPVFEHITIDLRNNMSGEHAATVERVYTAKEQIDIVCTVNLKPLDMAREGYFVGLGQYFDKYPGLWEEFPEWLWETQYVDDDYYVVPNYQRGSNPKVIYMRSSDAALVDWEGFCKLVEWKDGKSVGTLTQILDKIEEMYLDLKAAGRDICMINATNLFAGYNQTVDWKECLTDNGWSSKAQWYADFATGKVENYYMSDWFKTCWEYNAKWFDAGYYPDDIELNATQWQGWGSTTKGWIGFDQCAAWEQDEAVVSVNNVHEAVIGEKLVVIRYNDAPYMENRWAAGGNAVSSTSEHPEDAVAFLALLNSKEGQELYNMLVYGLEGVHWEWTDKENEIIRTFEYDSTQGTNAHSHAINKWCIGNTFYAYDNQGCAVGEREVALYINSNGVASPYAGVKIDVTELETEISNCSAVPGEYNAAYNYGIGGVAAFNELYPQFMDALKQAGAEDVTAELQAQIDDYIASRG